MTSAVCPACDGEGATRLPGVLDEIVCRHCKGTGRMTKSARQRLIQQQKYWNDWDFEMPMIGD